MTYNYIAQGAVVPTGTARVSIEYYYYVKYSIGSTAYDLHNAKTKGRIESVVIKKYKILYNPYDVLYTDTLNALWNENQLCSHSEAVEYAIAYYELKQRIAESLINS